jgi:hypothetical protein
MSTTREATNFVATQETPNILCNPKVHYRIYKSPLLVSVPSQTNPVNITPIHPFKIDLNIIHPLTSWSF